MISLIEFWVVIIEKQKYIHILYIKLHPWFFETADLENTAVSQQ